MRNHSRMMYVTSNNLHLRWKNEWRWRGITSMSDKAKTMKRREERNKRGFYGDWKDEQVSRGTLTSAIESWLAGCSLSDFWFYSVITHRMWVTALLLLSPFFQSPEETKNSVEEEMKVVIYYIPFPIRSPQSQILKLRAGGRRWSVSMTNFQSRSALLCSAPPPSMLTTERKGNFQIWCMHRRGRGVMEKRM